MAKRKKNNRKAVRRSLFLSVALVVLTLLIAFLVIVPIDLTAQIPLIKRTVESRINGTAHMERLSLKVLPLPRVIISGLTVGNDEGAVIRSESVSLKVPILPFFAGKVVVSSMELRGAKFFIKRYEDGTLNVQRLRKKRRVPVSFVLGSLANSQIRFEDLAVKGSPVFEVRDLNASFSPSVSGFKYDFKGSISPTTELSISGDAQRIDKVWRLGGEVDLKGVRLAMLSPYLDLRFPETDVAGTVDFEGTYTCYMNKKGSAYGSVRYSDVVLGMPAISNEKLRSKQGTAGVEMVWSPTEKYLELSSIDINVGEVAVKGSVRMKGPGQGTTLGFKLSTSPVPVSTIYKLSTLKGRSTQAYAFLRAV